MGIADIKEYSAKPKAALLSLTGLIGALSGIADGEISKAEFCDAFTRGYDPNSIMLYDGSGCGMAEPIEGTDEESGYNRRGDAVCNLFNSYFWDNPNATIRKGMPVSALMVTTDDACEIARWLWRRFFNTDAPQINALQPHKQQTAPTKADKRWPWGNHHTEMLGHVEAAASRFWVNYDPTDATTAPTNKDVSEWLITERKVSQKMAESIASILRPDGLATGPRK